MPETPLSPFRMQTARLRWTEHGVPVSDDFGDVYFSREGGLEESRYVFLQQNNLPQRWARLDPRSPGCFRIAETGFGTGLNFLAVWKLWRDSAPRAWRLHFVSCEKYPLEQADLRRALSAWPELQPLAACLQAQYPPALPGQHRLIFDDGRVVLDLLFAEATDAFRSLPDAIHPDAKADDGGMIDAWFLDGFAPAGNPSMWNDELFALIGLLSRPGATAATFTAAGIVRRGLAASGFDVRKVPGWGRKRDMLAAQHRHPPDVGNLKRDPVPWHLPPTPRHADEAIVIGAGLAGAHTALSLARRGVEVTVLERWDTPAREASGNPQGMLYTRLSPKMETLNQFTLSSFLFALRHYSDWFDETENQRCGVLQLVQTEKDREMLKQLREVFGEQQWVRFVDADTAAELAGLPLACPAIHFPGAGWLRPPDVCDRALRHDNISLEQGVRIAALEKADDDWRLFDAEGRLVAQAPVVVIAGGVDSAGFAPLDFLSLKPIRGQLTYLRDNQLAFLPKTVICHEGYLAPPGAGLLSLGATFDPASRDTNLRESDHRRNLEQLAEALPQLLADEPQVSGGRAALRCASNDYLPIVGCVPDAAAFDEDYAALRRNAKTPIPSPGRYHDGLYVNTAHGSRGLSSTPLCGEIIAGLVCGEPRPLPGPLMRALAPARFLIRDLARKRR